MSRRFSPVLLALLGWFLFSVAAQAAGGSHEAGDAGAFPRALETYADAGQPVLEQLKGRIAAEPFNLVASVIFLLAILHTFAAGKFMAIAHHLEHEHQEKLRYQQRHPSLVEDGDAIGPVSFKATIFHFLGEVEAIFGIWAAVLMVAITAFHGWGGVVSYIGHDVNFTEPMFVVIIMAIAATRPVLRFSEAIMAKVAGLGGSTPGAWWLSILTVGPLLGSFITEPAAMTICALLLGKKFYEMKPSSKLAYATIALLFVNISVGGTLTHFAAPPVLMVAGTWGWDTPHMLEFFGWKAAAGIVVANALYYLAFRGEFAGLAGAAARVSPTEQARVAWKDREDPVPTWITAVHLGFLGWTVLNAHYPALFIGGFLFFFAFHAATRHHQNAVALKSPLLVGFFLAGLVIHGGLQRWWIAPVLSSLGELPLFLGATFLTAFNDNAAITYLASLVPGFSDELKYAVVAGAVTGGGLTVIANAPNPAGQSILAKYFGGNVSPLHLALWGLVPTTIMALAFLYLPNLVP